MSEQYKAPTTAPHSTCGNRACSPAQTLSGLSVAKDRKESCRSDLGRYTELRAARVGYAFDLHGTADRLTRIKRTANNPTGRTRLTACHHMPLHLQHGSNGADGVKIERVINEHGEFYGYSGLARCGSVWACPLCSPYIASVRTQEIVAGLQNAHQAGYSVAFVSFTQPHDRAEALPLVLGDLRNSSQKMRATRAYKQLCKKIGLKGRITALEATYSDANGWHPHYHELWIYEGNSHDFEAALFELWEKSVTKQGRRAPSREHGVNVRLVDPDNVESVSKYPVFGNDLERAAREVTSWHTKNGRGFQSVTPWDLLCMAHEGDKRAEFLWLDFIDAVKGKAAIRWTRGLKELLNVDDLTDEEINDSADAERAQEVIESIRIDGESWAVITRNGWRSQVLQLVKVLGAEGLDIALQLLKKREAMRRANQNRLGPKGRYMDVGGGVRLDLVTGELCHRMTAQPNTQSKGYLQ